MACTHTDTSFFLKQKKKNSFFWWLHKDPEGRATCLWQGGGYGHDQTLLCCVHSGSMLLFCVSLSTSPLTVSASRLPVPGQDEGWAFYFLPKSGCPPGKAESSICARFPRRLEPCCELWSWPTECLPVLEPSIHHPQAGVVSSEKTWEKVFFASFLGCVTVPPTSASIFPRASTFSMGILALSSLWMHLSLSLSFSLL